MGLTKPTYAVNNIQTLQDITLNQSTTVKVLHDKTGADTKDYLEDVLIPELDEKFNIPEGGAAAMAIAAYNGTNPVYVAHLADSAYYLTKSGAAGTGSDETSLIQAWINTLPDNAVVYIPNKIFRIADLTLSKPLKFTGDGTFKKTDQSKKLMTVNLGANYSGKIVEFKGVTIDGDEQGAIGQEDIYVTNCGRIRFEDVKFKNPSKASVNTYSNVDNVKYKNCRFEEGIEYSGNDSATATFHIRNTAAAYLAVYNTEFETSITFNGGVGTQAGVIAVAPVAVYSENAVNAIVEGCRSINAGHIDLYSVNNQSIVAKNTFKDCHHPAIKVQESGDIQVEGNTILDNKCMWTSAIIVNPYIRAETYGSLTRKQYFGTVINNIVDGSANGGISIGGAKLTAAITARDATITQEDLLAIGYKVRDNTVRNVQKLGINMSYCKSCDVSGNTVEKWGIAGAAGSTTGIRFIEFYGYNKAHDNIVIGDNTVNNNIGIAFTVDTTSSIVTGSVADVQNNHVSDITSYHVFTTYAETVIAKYNHLARTIANQRLRIQNATTAIINGNYGFDISDGNFIYFSGVANKITDTLKPSKNEYYGTAAPVAGTFVKGDIVINTNPTEAGLAESKYIVEGWKCTAAGTPGTWLERRVLTGN